LTAAAAARFGYKCILVLSGEPPARASGNLVLDHLFGAEIVWCSFEEREQKLQQTFEAAWEAGQRPLLIPLGASTPSGALAYAFAFEEFLSQRVAVDWIVVASSSGGTQAGLALGAQRAGWQGKILGISIDHEALELQEKVAGLATQASELLSEKSQIAPQQIRVNADYLGVGYGALGAGEREAIHLFARLEGLLLDPVYTGRAAAALIDLARRHFFKPGENVLFWHTGGTPALFADPYAGMLVEG
jgi:1-aminocyclopropane-1-carboxylate deaminase/D-cysteine desulfhydrase-like pyridoxal-dependent ACC family enzyme